MTAWFAAFLVTLAVEVPITALVLAAVGWVGRDALSWRAALLLAAGVNLTHPVLWLVHPTGWWLVAAEAVIALVEGAVVAWYLRGRVPAWTWTLPLALAVTANLVSVTAGFALYAAGWLPTG